MKKIIIAGVIAVIISIANPVLAVKCLDGQIECNKKCIPDTEFCLNVSVGNIETMSLSNIFADYIIMWYNFIIGAIGILATVMIMYGGLKWLTSRGNSAAIGDAKEKISSALIGLVLVFLSYTILYLVNPNLTVIKMPKFPNVANVNYTGGTSESGYNWSESYLAFAEAVDPAVNYLADILTNSDSETINTLFENNFNIDIDFNERDLNDVDMRELNILADLGNYYGSLHDNSNNLDINYIGDNEYEVSDDNFMYEFLNNNIPSSSTIIPHDGIIRDWNETIYNTTFEYSSPSGIRSYPVTLSLNRDGRNGWIIIFN